MITIKGVTDEDFVNYKKPSMFISFPSCSWKCDIECGKQVCQNSTLASAPNIYVSTAAIAERYKNNPITSAIVCGGLEPFDSFTDLWQLIVVLRTTTEDDIVIYTGYNKNEISDKIEMIQPYKNIIIKYGRYIPGQQDHYDEVLGIYLASDNQYAERIS